MNRNKKNQVKRKTVILFAIMITYGMLSPGLHAYASWEDTEDGMKYEMDDGQYAVGFSVIDGNMYYFNSDGFLQTGKFYVEEEAAYYYADKNGVIQTGIINTKKSFYVADENGKLQTGFMEFEGNRYFFNGNADLVVGWFHTDDHWYYANSEGILQTGFLELDGYRYYLNTDGTRVNDTVMEIEGTFYVFNKDGSIDENATQLYPVLQYINTIRPDICMNTKVQACAILLASELVNGYVDSEYDVDTILKNRGVKCKNGYEFAYGGIEGYDNDKLISDMKLDPNLGIVLQDTTLTQVGLGIYEKDGLNYYDIIFISAE